MSAKLLGFLGVLVVVFVFVVVPCLYAAQRVADWLAAYFETHRRQ